MITLLDNNLKVIGDNCFRFCPMLEKIDISDTLQSNVGEDCFANCSYLEKLAKERGFGVMRDDSLGSDSVVDYLNDVHNRVYLRVSVLLCLELYNPYLREERDQKLGFFGLGLIGGRARARIRVLLVPEEDRSSSMTILDGKRAYDMLTADELWRMILLFV